MKITNVRFVRVQMPLSKPLGVGSWWNKLREYVLVWVDTDEGLTGTGFTYGGYFAGQGRLIEVALEEYLRPLLIDEDPEAIERLWQKMYRGCLMQSRKGVIVWAISAIDIALWDIRSKRARLPLWKLLGGAKSSLPAYATGGYYRPNEGLKELSEEVTRYKKLGLSAMKLKLGQLSPEQDEERLRVCREAWGPAARIAIDANNAWPDAHTALRAIRRFEKYDLWFIEEPLPPDNLDGAAELARVVDVPIVNGEPAVTRADLRDLITRRATDILQFDATMVGGVTEAIKGVHLAECHDMQFIPAWIAELHLNLALAANNSFAIEWHVPSEGTLQFTPLLEHSAQYRDGQIFGHERPGHGIEFSSEAVRKYQVGSVK